MDENHQRISELFLAARKQSPPDRRAFLEQACPDSPEIRETVEKMLEREASPPSFMKTDAMRDGTLAASIAVPRQIDSFHIKEVLGEGGMGVVYLAEQQEPVRRRAALKVIRLGLATPKLVARFEAERQLLASLNHPNVAGVFDGGTTEQGLPYLVMEYVDGEPITNYCDRERLVVRQRLDLFKQVCAGVQHAHQNAVIHRDLKPTNVLVGDVDGDPLPKIIDFGVAKTLNPQPGDATPTTEYGQVVGTPEYMSPEQTYSSGHPVDTRTDVYSLGVMLYELLAGLRPCDASVAEVGDRDALRQRIRAEDPPSMVQRLGVRKEEGLTSAQNRQTDLSGLVSQLRGELDWIVAKALAKEPERRYSSPADLAADLDRHLLDEPVLAGPPSRAYRLKKLARRHRGSAAVGLVLALLLVGFSTTVAVQNRRVVKERTALEEVTEYLIGMLGAPTATDDRLARHEEYQILDRARETIARLDDQPLLRARMMQMLGRYYLDLRLLRDAETLLVESHAALRDELGDDDPTTLKALDTVAYLRAATGESDLSYRLRQEVLERRRESLGEDHPDTLFSRRWLTKHLSKQRNFTEAEIEAREMAAGHAKTLGPDHPETLAARAVWCSQLIELGRLEEAEPALLELREQLARVLGERHYETSVATYNLAVLYAQRGDRSSALMHLARAVENGLHIGQDLTDSPELETLAGDPEFEALNRRYDLNSTDAWAGLELRATQHSEAGRFEASLATSKDLLDARRRVLGTDHMKVLTAQYDVGNLLNRLDRYEEAEAQLRDLVEHLEALMASPLSGFRPKAREDFGLWADTQWVLAQSLMRRDAYADAIPLLENAQSYFETDYSPAIATFADACIHSARGERERALHLIEEAVVLGFDMVSWLDYDLALKPLYGNPRFEAAAAEIRKRGSVDP